MIKTKVKVIPESALEPYIKSIIFPLRFKRISLENNIVTIFAGQSSKAALIGRDKIRAAELERILKDHFGIRELKIV